jgi:hypothetical protein
MASEQGYSNQKKKGKAQFKTIHSSGSDSYAEQVVPKYLSDLVVPTTNSLISSITDILGSNGQVEFWEIAFIDPHYAIKGDVFRIKGSADDLFNFEFEIVSVVNATTIRVLPISEVKPTTSDFGVIKRWVTANSDDDGNPKVSITPAPVKFLLDGVTTDVSKDTVTPANSKLLPTENLIAQASLSSIDGKFTTLNATDFATSAKQDTSNNLLTALDSKLAGSLAPVEHDEVGLSYVGATTDISTVTYKLAGNPVATLTLTYDGSNRLIGVVRS